MHHVNLEGVRVAVLATDGFEQVELTVPVDALEEHGAEVEIVSLRPGRIRGVNHLFPGKKVRVDRTINTAVADDYDAVLIPGGLMNPDLLRQDDGMLDFVRDADMAGKPIAVICHGPWLLVSAELVPGRRLTSWPGIVDDVRNAGGIWTDEPVVRDRNWVSSRHPGDLPHFVPAMLELFATHTGRGHAARRDEHRGMRMPHVPMPDLPLGKMLMGGALAAGIAYFLTQRQGGQAMEYVEVYDMDPEDAVPAAAATDEVVFAGGDGAAYESGYTPPATVA